MHRHLSSMSEQLVATQLKRMLYEAAGVNAVRELHTCFPQLAHLLIHEQSMPTHQFTQRVHQILSDRCRAVTDWDMSATGAAPTSDETLHVTANALARLREAMQQHEAAGVERTAPEPDKPHPFDPDYDDQPALSGHPRLA